MTIRTTSKVTADMAEYEDGVEMKFSSRNEAVDYAKFSNHRLFRHRFLSQGNQSYVCAESANGCTARRRIVSVGLEFLVKGKFHHNHTRIAKGENRWLNANDASKFRKAPRLLGPMVKQSLNSEIDLTLKQIANRSYYETAKATKGSIGSWINQHPDATTGPCIAGYLLAEDSFVVVLSSTSWVEKFFHPNAPFCAEGFFCVDGYYKKTKSFAVFRLGSMDVRHAYHDLAIGIISSHEGTREIAEFLRITSNFVKQLLPQATTGLVIAKVMCDGSSSIRNAFNEFQPIPVITFGQCYFHVTHAINERHNGLSKTELDVVLKEISILSAFPPACFSRAVNAILTAWRSRHPKTADIANYVAATWIDRFPGWNVGFLGMGTPRCNNALESSWRSLETFLGATCISVCAMLDVLYDDYIPFLLRNHSSMSKEKRQLPKDDISAATHLAASNSTITASDACLAKGHKSL